MNLLELIGILLGVFLVAHGVYTWYLILFTEATYIDTVFKSVLNYVSIAITLIPALVFACIVFVTMLWVITSYLSTIQLW